MLTNINQLTQSHGVRTFFAGLAGTLAVYLLLTGITSVWLMRTLTDTPTFVQTVAPLATKPAIQKFVAKTVADAMLSGNPPEQVAALLPAVSRPVLTGLSGSQLTATLEPVVEAQVLGVVQAPGFATLWTSTLTTAHQTLMRQLNSGNTQSLTLDLTPVVDGVLAQLKTTELGPAIAQADIPANAGMVTIPSKAFAGIYRYYRQFEAWTIAVIAGAIVMLVAAALLSVSHGKTIRRILMTGGILALLQGLMLALPWLVTIPRLDATTQAAIKAIIEQVVRNLMILSLAVGMASVAGAIVSAVVSRLMRPRTSVAPSKSAQTPIRTQKIA